MNKIKTNTSSVGITIDRKLLKHIFHMCVMLLIDKESNSPLRESAAVFIFKIMQLLAKEDLTFMDSVLDSYKEYKVYKNLMVVRKKLVEGNGKNGKETISKEMLI